MDFEGTMGDEMSVKMGDVVKHVAKASEEGWLTGELRGKRGIFPANFATEVPVYLIGEGKREPRSIRKSKKTKPTRKCEVAFAYDPFNEDELQLVVGETLEIIREIKLKVGNHYIVYISLVVECCQVMFEYKAKTDDELDLKPGDVVVILRKQVGVPKDGAVFELLMRAFNLHLKETEDDGWWEGELNGRCGLFPDNFVMLIPPMDTKQSGVTSQPPARNNNTQLPAPKDDRAATRKEDATLESLQAEIQQLRMALELLETRHDREMQEVREQLRTEGSKRVALQEEVQSLRKK
ncbi:CD2-associated protein [Liparis tanakae]|uniref:CD2-associated protein n=1 Tax=Liparis tanakae TaxID=230148 RepID=A0A4Z2JFR6_9TELE|nr:CD2-associated protein [Liparis tanakae]